MSRNRLVFFFLFFTLLSFSQQRQFAHVGLAEGLPQETVLSMVTDTLGMVWLGTSDGLVRYDSNQFHLPLPDTSSQLDIAGYRIGALASFNNYVLAGTGQKGLIAYDVVKETTLAVGNNNANCTAIAPLKDGFLAGYFDGSIRYFNEALEEIQLDFKNQTPSRINTLRYFDKYLFIGTDDGKLFKGSWNPSTSSIALTPIPLEVTKINTLQVLANVLYIGTSQNLFQMASSEEQPSIVTVPLCSESTIPLDITDIVQVSNTTFLATSTGLYEWPQGGCASQYTSAEKNDAYHLNANAINDLHQVHETLLIGHITLDITEIEPPNVFDIPSTHWNLDNPSVFAIYRSGKYLLTGTSSGLVLSLADNPTVFRLFPRFRLRGITADRENNIWFVTSNGAFFIPHDRLNIDNPDFIEIPVSEENPTALSSKNLRNIYTDRQGSIWITTFSTGICKFVGNTNNNDFTFKRYAYGAEAVKLPSPLTLSLVQDNENNYWVSTQKGLSKMSLSTNGEATFKTYTEEQGLSTNGVLSAYVGSDHTLWVASRKGLNKYLANEDRFIAYGKRDGLTNTFVYNILEDAQQELWLTTNGGLFRFNPLENHFSNYLPKDGVQSTEFNLGAVFQDTSSRFLYAGGISGLNKFNPSRVNELDKASPLVFTRVKSRDSIVKVAIASNSNLTVAKTASLVFKHDDFPVTLSYAGLDYRPSKNSSYEYRLLPQDEQWNRLQNGQDIQLLNLSPDSYTLELRGLSRGIAWDSPTLTIDLKVTPPWYRSTLAYFLYALLIAGIVYIYYRISMQRTLASQEARRLQDLDSLKTRFITNITHEFRTPLTIILGYIDTLKSKLDKKTEEKNDLEVIENNSTNLLQLVNQMLDLAKLEKGRLPVTYHKENITSFTASIVSAFENSAREKGIHLELKTDFKDPLIDIDAEKLRQILSNLISNALKFTDHGSILIKISENTSHYRIVVKDTGHGIPEEDMASIFERFYQVENNTFKIAQGTGIGLALTKELVQLLGGSIHVASIQGEGTTFTLRLPLTRNAPPASYTVTGTSVNTGINVPEAANVSNEEQANIVLVVEDNPDMSRYIGNCLADEFSVIFATNGQEGLVKATEEIPDIIVSDVMMPLLDGFEMTQKLQQQETTNHIPVILLTSKAAQEDKIEGIESGADVYFTKPFHKQELLLRISKLIEKRKRLQQKYQSKNYLKNGRETATFKDYNELFIEKAIGLIEKHIQDHNFGTKQLAALLAISESQLYRKLKALTNTSTALFIRSIRLEKAKELLQTTPKNVSEIAYETGFNDPNWFGKAFKEKFGKTPSEIQK